MPKSGNNIFYRKDGRWKARYFKDYDRNNHIIYGYVYGESYDDAKEKRDKILEKNDYSNNKINKRQNKTLESLIESWLLQKKLTVKESTYIRYTELINVHIKPTLGKINLSRINNDLISKFIYDKLQSGNSITHQGLGNKTIKDIVTVLKQITKYGNIYINVNSPKIQKHSVTILELKEQKKLEKYIFNNINYINLGILLSLYTGLRIGEVCALQWKDINIKKATLTVNHTVLRIKDLNTTTRSKTKVIINEPKTDNSKRIIPIPSSIMEYIKCLKSNDNYYVISNSEKSIEPRIYYEKYKKILKELNMEKYNFHILRHTFATRCISLGFDPKTLSEILGHSDIKITLSLYVHPTNALKKINMEKLKLLN